MPFAHSIVAGESINSVAALYQVDWREIADLNGLDPLQDVLLDGVLEIPTAEEILAPARPILARFQDAEALLQRANDLLPESLSSYTTEALRLVGEINGTIGQVESTITDILGEADRVLSGASTYQVVEWLLTKVSPDRSRFAGALAKVQEISGIVREVISN